MLLQNCIYTSFIQARCLNSVFAFNIEFPWAIAIEQRALAVESLRSTVSLPTVRRSGEAPGHFHRFVVETCPNSPFVARF